MVKAVNLLVVLLILFSGVASADVTEVTATVDRNPVTANESFVLTVTVNDDVSNNAFEASKLLQDFVVGRTSVSRQTSMINGRLSKQTRFTTVLIPQSPGEYTIPEITIKGVSSKPINLQVLKQGTDSDTEQRIAFIEAQVDSTNVYFQQPITYIARLFLAADLNKGNLVPPQVDNADVQQIGRDEESTQMVNGRRYKVYQRVYQITPNKSGSITIPGARFDGEVFTQGQRSIFSSFSNTQPVSAIAEGIDVNVQPVPDSWTGHWLPSELVSLSASISPEQEEYKAGEPITLSYMLTAVGVKPEQLPEIAPDFPSSFRVYPDNDETDSFTRNGVVISQKTVSFALVPEQAGNLTIPEFELPWFNTKTEQRTLAKTESMTLPVIMPAGMTQSDITEAAPTDSKPDSEHTEITNTSERPDNNTVASKPLVPIWVIGALAVGLAISLMLNLYLLIKRNSVKRQEKTVKPESADNLNRSKSWQDFQKACKNNDAKAAQESLINWAHTHLDVSVNSLSEIAKHLNIEDEITPLQASLYNAGGSQWTEGKVLYQKVRKQVDNLNVKKQHSNLPQLYPS